MSNTIAHLAVAAEILKLDPLMIKNIQHIIWEQ